MAEAGEVTQLLRRAESGDESAVERLIPLIYDELRALASRQLDAERRDHTLQATALAHEAYLRLTEQKETRWTNRSHFFALAATSIRRILIDYARARAAEKRVEGRERVAFEGVERLLTHEPRQLVELDEALERLARFDARKARVVELRFFGGLDVGEVARVLDVSTPTVKRDWSAARAWLQAEMRKEPDAEP